MNQIWFEKTLCRVINCPSLQGFVNYQGSIWFQVRPLGDMVCPILAVMGPYLIWSLRNLCQTQWKMDVLFGICCSRTPVNVKYTVWLTYRLLQTEKGFIGLVGVPGGGESEGNTYYWSACDLLKRSDSEVDRGPKDFTTSDLVCLCFYLEFRLDLDHTGCVGNCFCEQILKCMCPYPEVQQYEHWYKYTMIVGVLLKSWYLCVCLREFLLNLKELRESILNIFSLVQNFIWAHLFKCF